MITYLYPFECSFFYDKARFHKKSVFNHIMSVNRKAAQIQYAIEAIDVDGDGIPDGDLVTQYKNGKIVARKFVPTTKIKKLVESQVKAQDTVQQISAKRIPKSRNVAVRAQIPENMASTQQAIVVQNRSGFGEYVKAGAGVSLGAVAVSGLMSGLAAIFE
jgi:hypothetical protein